jgi:hypothetical protein
LRATAAAERGNGEYGDDERVENMEHILELVQRLGLEAGQARLEEWRAQTIAELKLEA